MQYKLEESIACVIDCLNGLSYYPDLFELCIDALNNSQEDYPGYVFWLLDNMKCDFESRVEDALYKMKCIQTLLDESAIDCPAQTRDACLVMRYVHRQGDCPRQSR